VQHPSHAYTAPGTYSVSLMAIGPGGSDTLVKNAYITVSTPPTAAFAASDSSGAAPLTVTFSDSSTGAPTAWNWDFGDAAVDTVQNPSHTYVADGTYTVTLIVSNACAADTSTMTIQIITPTGVAGGAPQPFGLRQNYPNPFNPSTTIEYSLLRAGRATLTVYDVSGRRVATLVDREMPAGLYHVAWRAPRNMPSGVYFARLKSGAETSIRRLVLVR